MLSVSAADLEAITVDAFGTLVELRDPVPALRRALRERGVERDDEAVLVAFRTEAAFYVDHAHEGRDPGSLAELRRRCAAVFLDAAGADLDPDEFVAPFVGALAFRPVPGAVVALDRLAAAGLALACVTNWDVGFHAYLDDLGLADRFAAVVTSGEAGAPKPSPRIFELALGRLAVPAARALHVGDGEVDRAGALAAGLAFAPAPLVTLPERLGLP
jgi:HAD superfamily hydrolase (TIGR01509 family)